MIKKENIDGGKGFDFGKTSSDYAKYRDIYPDELYNSIIDRGYCVEGQSVLDLGTGTGVLPRNMYKYGAKWTGVDISGNQIRAAKDLSMGLDITYYNAPVEELNFKDDTFDAITACQCFHYFDHNVTAPIISRILKPDGRFFIMCMEWLPFEDEIAMASEELVLKYSPNWTGCKETMRPIKIPEVYNEYFEVTFRDEYRINVPFTRETWNGRMKSCRGIGASLSSDMIALWEKEHLDLLYNIADEKFNVRHYIAIAELKKKKAK